MRKELEMDKKNLQTALLGAAAGILVAEGVRRIPWRKLQRRLLKGVDATKKLGGVRSTDLDAYRMRALTHLLALKAVPGEERKAGEIIYDRLSAREHCEPRSYGKHEPYTLEDYNAFQEALAVLFSAVGEDKFPEVLRRLASFDDEEFDLILGTWREDRVARQVDAVVAALKEGIGKAAEKSNAGIEELLGEVRRRLGLGGRSE